MIVGLLLIALNCGIRMQYFFIYTFFIDLIKRKKEKRRMIYDAKRYRK